MVYSLFLQRRSRRRAKTSGSRSPSRMARMIRIPVAPVMSADHVGKLQVHLRQGLLHMLDMRGRITHQIHPLPHIGAQGAHLLGRAEGAFQQPIAVQPLQPLAVQHVALAAGHVLDMTGIDQPNLQPPALQDLKDRESSKCRWIP